jgi:hypothetical protein
MRDLNEGPEPEPPDTLWAEAVWGVGLIGSVLVSVVVLVTVFGH